MKNFPILVMVCWLMGWGAFLANAQEQNQASVVETTFFSIQAQPGVDVGGLAQRLNVDYFLKTELLGEQEGQSNDDEKKILAKTVDAIFLDVQETLGLNLSTFHGTIILVNTPQEVQRAFHRIYGIDFRERSFYCADQNIIYISTQDLSLFVLGHEMAHALITHFFVVPPPPKVQEVLAGYVEFHLRKITGSLPAAK